ncbi:MAG TPA: hypothetical protein VF070_10485 [Streptosporangiaceae bacterium]
MRSIFGPNRQQVLALIASISAMSAEQVDQVTSAWRLGNPRHRNQAWAQLSRTIREDEQRYGVLAAASLTRREALDVARRVHRSDWAFWAAACDAGAAVAAGVKIGRHYETLVAPFSQVVPTLARDTGATLAEPDDTVKTA